jgi:hypothetical protein
MRRPVASTPRPPPRHGPFEPRPRHAHRELTLTAPTEWGPAARPGPPAPCTCTPLTALTVMRPGPSSALSVAAAAHAASAAAAAPASPLNFGLPARTLPRSPAPRACWPCAGPPSPLAQASTPPARAGRAAAVGAWPQVATISPVRRIARAGTPAGAPVPPSLAARHRTSGFLKFGGILACWAAAPLIAAQSSVRHRCGLRPFLSCRLRCGLNARRPPALAPPCCCWDGTRADPLTGRFPVLWGESPPNPSTLPAPRPAATSHIVRVARGHPRQKHPPIGNPISDLGSPIAGQNTGQAA